MTSSASNKYAAASRCFIDQAKAELQIEDFVQASEKAWGAAACALKAVAEQREWNHRKHSLLYDVSGQIADELAQPSLLERFGVANALHQNYYEDWIPEEVVANYIESIEALVSELEDVRRNPTPPFTIETRAQRRRLDRLTAKSEPTVDIPSE